MVCVSFSIRSTCKYALLLYAYDLFRNHLKSFVNLDVIVLTIPVDGFSSHRLSTLSHLVNPPSMLGSSRAEVPMPGGWNGYWHLRFIRWTTCHSGASGSSNDLIHIKWRSIQLQAEVQQDGIGYSCVPGTTRYPIPKAEWVVFRSKQENNFFAPNSPVLARSFSEATENKIQRSRSNHASRGKGQTLPETQSELACSFFHQLPRTPRFRTNQNSHSSPTVHPVARTLQPMIGHRPFPTFIRSAQGLRVIRA